MGVIDTGCLDSWGATAKKFTVNNILDRTMTLNLDQKSGEQDPGGGMTFSQLLSFGRLLAFVEEEDRDFSEELVSHGLARVYTEGQSSREDLLIRLQKQAQANYEGLWGCRQKSPVITPAPNQPPVTSSDTTEPIPTMAPQSAKNPTPSNPIADADYHPRSNSDNIPDCCINAGTDQVSNRHRRPYRDTCSSAHGHACSNPYCNFGADSNATPTSTPVHMPLPNGLGCAERQVDVNSASADERELIIHIGPARVGDAVQIRPFDSLEDLLRINGIGPSRLTDIQAEGIACVGIQTSRSSYPGM